MRKTIIDQSTGNVVNVIVLVDGADWSPTAGQVVGADGGEMGQRWDGTAYVLIQPSSEPEEIIW